MTSLCETVRSEMEKVFEGVPIGEWKVVADGQDTCIIFNNTFMINIDVDRRDHLVTSSITFLDVNEEDQERLYSHVLAKLCPNIKWNTGESAGDYLRNIILELENIKALLDCITINSFSGRDLQFFYLGYNSGYTQDLSAGS